MDKPWKKVDEVVKKGLVLDKDLNDFLKPIFPEEVERRKFIKRCLQKITTRRMLLRAQWYTEIADDQEKVRQSRPALKLIFLMALAEALTKQRTGKSNIGSFDAIREFFRFISKEDKNTLQRGFGRTLLHPKHHVLKFSSILKILYEIRNRAVHGDEYWEFSFMDKEDKEKHKGYQAGIGITHFGLITSGYLGSRKKKKRVSLDIQLTYEELRDIFRRTAIANIKSLL